MMSWRLPKRKTLGPGFTIQIVEGVLTDSAAAWEIGNHGGVITLIKGLTKAQQRYYYSHELIHAAIDYHHEQNKSGATV